METEMSANVCKINKQTVVKPYEKDLPRKKDI